MASRAREIAAELAVHFEKRARLPQAVHYLRQAGENAVRRSAHQEAITHFTRGLDLLSDVPRHARAHAARTRLQVALGVPLLSDQGVCSSQRSSTPMAGHENCVNRSGNQPELFAALVGLCSFVSGASGVANGARPGRATAYACSARARSCASRWRLTWHSGK